MNGVAPSTTAGRIWNVAASESTIFASKTKNGALVGAHCLRVVALHDVLLKYYGSVYCTPRGAVPVLIWLGNILTLIEQNLTKNEKLGIILSCICIISRGGY